MVCNDLVMPILLRMPWLRLTERGDLTRLLIAIRRGTIVLILFLGYLYFRFIGGSHALVTIGLLSFAAVAQFAPAIIGGMYWREATRTGALAGLTLGFTVWVYTLLLPSFLDFISTIDKLVDFLIKADPKNSFLKQIAAKTVKEALQTLPEELPLGLRHGDFGLSNILAGPDGKITVLDTPAICHSPIYEDLAYLLVGLKAKWSQVLSLKLAYDSYQFAVYEREFLAAYFGQSPIPDRIIQLYEVQALLVRWSSKIFILTEQSVGKNKFWKTFQLWQMRRFFKTMLRDLSNKSPSRQD
jgi:hypothetical protein